MNENKHRYIGGGPHVSAIYSMSSACLYNEKSSKDKNKLMH